MAKRRFLGLEEPAPDAPWTIHITIGPKPAEAEPADERDDEEDDDVDDKTEEQPQT
jgi:hypothetical protein